LSGDDRRELQTAIRGLKREIKGRRLAYEAGHGVIIEAERPYAP